MSVSRASSDSEGRPRVLVTRDARQSRDLCTLLERTGLEPVCVPTIAVGPVDDLTALDSALDRIDTFTYIILPSANAARVTGERLRARGITPAQPGGCPRGGTTGGHGVGPRIVCGPSTAAVVQAFGWQVTLTPSPFSGEAAVVAITAERGEDLSGVSVLVPRAEDGGATLAQSLRERHAVVDEVVVYRTTPVQESPALVRALTEGPPEAVTFFSPSAVQGFASASVGLDNLGKMVVACIGATTAAAAREHGFRVDVVAPDTTAAALVDALAEHLRRDRPANQAGRRNSLSMTKGCLVVAGTSHHLAPVAVRERLLGKSGERAIESLLALVGERVGPGVVVSTCNRLEVYCWSNRRPRDARQRLVNLLAEWSGLTRPTLSPYLYVRIGVEAAYHLIRVAAGLDSLALGESQILGQVRTAWQDARRAASLGAELNGLFSRAVEAARRLRREGALSRHPSVAAVAATEVAQCLGELRGRRVAVLGAGVTGQEAVRALLDGGAAHVTLLNRSRHRIAEIQGEFTPAQLQFGMLDALPRALMDADALVCATASPVPVVTAAAVAEALSARVGRPLVIVDIAVPRDVESAVGELDGVQLVDLDSLAARCALDEGARRQALEHLDAMARTEAEDYFASLSLRQAVPDIVALRTQAETVRREELRRVEGRLARLTPRERAAVEQMTHAIVQKLLHPPTMALRRSGSLSPRAGRRLRETVLTALSASPVPRRRRPGASASQSQYPDLSE